MKRSGMPPRTKPLARSLKPLNRKRPYAPGSVLNKTSEKKRRELAIERKWKRLHPFCWHCGKSPVDLCHLVPGVGRKCDPRLWASLCRKHHTIFDSWRVYRGPDPIRPPYVLWLKQRNDPQHFDPEFVARAGVGYQPEIWGDV